MKSFRFERARTSVVQCAAVLGVALLASTAAYASSHREAPFITSSPKVDGTDFYMFTSYEPGRAAFTTLIADYQPVQVAGAGPQYYAMDQDALYEIHIDNTADGVEDLTFQFRFQNTLKDIHAADQRHHERLDPAGTSWRASRAQNPANLNVRENVQRSTLVTRRSADGPARTNVAERGRRFEHVREAGRTTSATRPSATGAVATRNYAAAAHSTTSTFRSAGCTTQGKHVRRVNARIRSRIALGQVFDLINLNPLGLDQWWQRGLARRLRW